MLNNIVGLLGLYSGDVYFFWGGAYIWNGVSVIFRGLQYTVEKSLYFLVIGTQGSQVDPMVI